MTTKPMIIPWLAQDQNIQACPDQQTHMVSQMVVLMYFPVPQAQDI
jgi:hypothetical protein